MKPTRVISRLFFTVVLTAMILQPIEDAVAQHAAISGHVRTSDGTPIEGVQMNSLGTTDASGYYAITAYAGFGAVITPKKDGWTFTPEHRGYAGAGTYTDEDYVGTNVGGGGTVTPNIITFAEDRYKSVAGTRLYRGGPNTLIDTEMGLDFYVAYGDMQVMHSTGVDYELAFSPYTPSGTDPRGRIVITFNNLQQYVRIDVATDGTPIHSPAYLRTSYYRDTDPSNPLYTEDGGGNIEYTNTDTGIKMLIVDTHYAENGIDELEFLAFGGQTESHPNPVSLIALSGFHQWIPIAWQAPASRTPQGSTINERP